MMDDNIYAEAIESMDGYNFDGHIQMNKMIMNKVDQTTSETLRVPSAQERLLRAKLIFEEAIETIEALGISVNFDVAASQSEKPYDITVVFNDAGEASYNPKEVLDGVCDLTVVANGTLLCCGLHNVLEDALKRVDLNNWSKVKNGVIRNADGKYQKPPGYKQVVLDDLIERVS